MNKRNKQRQRIFNALYILAAIAFLIGFIYNFPDFMAGFRDGFYNGR